MCTFSVSPAAMWPFVRNPLGLQILVFNFQLRIVEFPFMPSIDACICQCHLIFLLEAFEKQKLRIINEQAGFVTFVANLLLLNPTCISVK